MISIKTTNLLKKLGTVFEADRKKPMACMIDSSLGEQEYIQFCLGKSSFEVGHKNNHFPRFREKKQGLNRVDGAYLSNEIERQNRTLDRLVNIWILNFFLIFLKLKVV